MFEFECFFNYLVTTFGKISILAFFIWTIKEILMGICTCNGNLRNKIVVITGATSGIGTETALALAKNGARLILGCREIDKGYAIKRMIESRVPEALEIEVLPLDLSSLWSISKFVSEVEDMTTKVQILINNASIFLMEKDKFGNFVKKHTPDGLELVMGTNYFGHFYLTHQLLDLLKNGGTKEDPSRIISTTSFGHMIGDLRPDLLDCNANQKRYDPLYQYCSSKMAIMHWTNRLARKLKKVNVISLTVNPGLVRTTTFLDQMPKREKYIMTVLGYIFGKNCYQGAQPLIHSCLTTNLKINGSYMADCREERIFRSNQLGKAAIEETLFDYTTDLLNHLV